MNSTLDPTVKKEQRAWKNVLVQKKPPYDIFLCLITQRRLLCCLLSQQLFCFQEHLWLGPACLLRHPAAVLYLECDCCVVSSMSCVAQSALRTQSFEQCFAHEPPPVFGCRVFEKKCLFVIVLP